jgi:hypothetical protein
MLCSLDLKAWKKIQSAKYLQTFTNLAWGKIKLQTYCDSIFDVIFPLDSALVISTQ